MKANEFSNGSFKRTVKGNIYIEITRQKTKSVSGWYVSIYNHQTMVYTLNQYHEKFFTAKKHYFDLCDNFPTL